MAVYRLYTYHVWGNEEDGWEVNNVFETDVLADINPTWSDRKLISILKIQYVIQNHIHSRYVEVEGDEDVLYFSYKGKPEFELRKEIEENPAIQGTKIYDRIEAIEAKKGKDSLWPGEDFRHDFKDGGEIIGLPNGDLLIKKKKKRLWKNFDY